MENNVKVSRNRLNLTQEQLAKNTFVTKRTIISIEKGVFNPGLLLAYRLSLALKTNLYELFLLDENNNNYLKKLEEHL